MSLHLLSPGIRNAYGNDRCLRLRVAIRIHCASNSRFAASRIGDRRAQFNGLVDRDWFEVFDVQVGSDAPKRIAFAYAFAIEFVLMCDCRANAVAVKQAGDRAAVQKVCWPGALFCTRHIRARRYFAVPVALDLHPVLILGPAAVAMIAGNQILYCDHAASDRFGNPFAANCDASHADKIMPRIADTENQVGCRSMSRLLAVPASINTPIISA